MDKQEVKKQVEAEIEKWQTKIDEAKVQMHLGAKELEDKLAPHVEKMEQELQEADNKRKQLEEVAGDAWQDIHHGLKISFKAMDKAFSDAMQHCEKQSEK
jgi:chromosome segregation ATPase